MFINVLINVMRQQKKIRRIHVIYMGGRADLQRIYNGLVTNLSPCRKHHPLQVQAIRLRLLPARPCDR